VTTLPWTVLGLAEGFSCTHIELRLRGDGYLDHLEGGVVSKPETLNYRTFRAERGGLFDPEIFGALEGFDGGLDSYRAAVEVEHSVRPRGDEPTPPHPRRDRFGKVLLCEPVMHPMFLLRGADWLERRTKLTIAVIRNVLAERCHVVVDSVAGTRAPGSTITADELDACSEDDRTDLELETGATAIRALLRRRGHDVDPLIDHVYVLPVQFRPLVPLDGGRFATSDLNDLYRRVINRNNRHARLIELDAPQIILQSERSQLQAAVDNLFDNAACDKPVTGPKEKQLFGLWDLADGERLPEHLRGLDEWIGKHGHAALERGLPWDLFRTWRVLQALGFELPAS
jgi:DNA-directed RNA polymerase subunit beta'